MCFTKLFPATDSQHLDSSLSVLAIIIIIKVAGSISEKHFANGAFKSQKKGPVLWQCFITLIILEFCESES